MPQFDPAAIVDALNRHGVDYVGIGMFAAVVQGAAHDTEDVDVSFEASRENVQRLVAALTELDVRFRIDVFPEGLEIPGGLSVKTVLNSTSLALICPYGNLDVMLMPDGTRGYPDLVRDSAEMPIAEGVRMRVASLRDIIRSKEAAGREKDRAVLPALRRLVGEVAAAERASEAAPDGAVGRPGQKPGRPALAQFWCRSAVCRPSSADEPFAFTVPGMLERLGPQACPRCRASVDQRDGQQLEGVDLVRGWYLHERRR